MRSLYFALRRYTRGIWHGFNDPAFKGLSFFIVLLILIGTAVFSFLEHWKIVDAFYFSVATIVTVGYGDLTPKTDAGKLFAAAFMLIGVGTILTYVSLIGYHTKANGHRKIFHKDTKKAETANNS